MKKRGVLAAIYALTFIVVAFNTVFFIKDNCYYNIDNMPVGELLYPSMSPDGGHYVNVYKVSSSRGKAIRAELVTVGQNGETTKKNIYWQTKSNSALVGWVSDDVVNINDHLIDISSNETYDSRRDG